MVLVLGLFTFGTDEAHTLRRIKKMRQTAEAAGKQADRIRPYLTRMREGYEAYMTDVAQLVWYMGELGGKGTAGLWAGLKKTGKSLKGINLKRGMNETIKPSLSKLGDAFGAFRKGLHKS